MKLRFFTRTDSTVVRETFAVFKREFFYDKSQAYKIIGMITTGHLLRFVVSPLIISFIIQTLIVDPTNLTKLSWLIGGAFVTYLTTIVVNHIGFDNLFRSEEEAQTRLLNSALKQLVQQSYQFFSERKVGTLSGDLMNYSRSYLTFMDNYFMHTSHLVVGFVASIVVIGFLAPLLVLPTILILVLLVTHSVRSMNKRSQYRNERKRLTSQLGGSLADIMGNQLLVRVFAREHEEVRQIEKERDAIADIASKEITIVNHEAAVRQVLVYGFQLVTIIIFVYLGTQQIITVAALVFTFAYLNRATDTIFGITSIVRTFEQAFLDAAPVIKMLQLPHAVVDKPNANELIVTKSSIEFRHVDFAYQDATRETVFSNLSLNIPSGQHIGLAGYSGGGKTTLTKLLLRFANIEKGEICVDQQNIAEITQTSLRGAIAYVPQDPYLFHRSLRDNIAYGRPDATEEQIIAAAKKAYAWDFIEKLPHGLETTVGERGVKLSGGQRQRVAIARAILKDAPILILDEATSALDSESEIYIQKALTKLMQGRTSIVIAHRLSTIAKLDRIIVLDEGKIAEDGSHEQLLKNDSIYAKLWRHQSGGFIEESAKSL